MSTVRDDPATWARALRESLDRFGVSVVDRVDVVPETTSTQDAAFAAAAGRPGLVLLAERQSAGRGRLGRRWVHSADLGLAATFVLDGSRYTAERLSLAAGLAAARALDGRVPSFYEFGLRWPNDVVEPTPHPGGGRKVAGVLIEVRERLALVGIGINIEQRSDDFPAEVRGRSVSLRQLGSGATRIEVAQWLVRELQWTLDQGVDALADAWMRRDVLTGSRQSFMHAGQVIAGVVDSIDPRHEIVVRTGPGRVVRLPALTTSLVREH